MIYVIYVIYMCIRIYREPITKVEWLRDYNQLTRVSYYLCASSTDGRVLFWSPGNKMTYPTAGGNASYPYLHTYAYPYLHILTHIRPTYTYTYLHIRLPILTHIRPTYTYTWPTELSALSGLITWR